MASSPDTAQPAYLTINGTAKLVHVAPVTVRRWIAAGALLAFKVGPVPDGKTRDVRPIRIPRDAIDGLLHPIGGPSASPATRSTGCCIRSAVPA